MNQGSGAKTFAVVAALLIGLSWIRLDPPDSTLSANGGFAGGEVTTEELSDEELAALEEDPEALQAAIASGEVVLGEGGKPVARRVLTGGSAGRTATAGRAASGSDDPSGTGGTSKSGVNIGGGGATGGGTSGGGTGGGGGPAECKAGRNGGSTDKGVTATAIKVASPVVQDGPAKTLLEPSITAMRAVFDKVNKAGGICGRRIELKVDNDSFDRARGQQIIRNYIEGNYFALAVVPSAEGLGAAIESGDIDKAGIPVVGTDGMRKEQYSSPWVWPVAASTTTTMRVMVKYAAEQRGAKSFAIVYDSKYKFGIEGFDAFKDQVGKVGGNLVTAQALDPAQPGYASEASAFNSACEGKCDMVALLLLPDTASKWMSKQPALGTKYTAGAQTLFTDNFAKSCVQQAKNRCHGIAVWTGYNPPIGALASKPGVAAYVNDVKAVNPGIDVRNQFLQGAYLGANVFVEALRKAGPNLTRAGLKSALDQMTYSSDLASPLSWTQGNHRANTRAQSFSMAVSQGTFTDWKQDSGFIADPNPSAG